MYKTEDQVNLPYSDIMKSWLIFAAIVAAFGLTFSKHISILMYPLSGVLFYFYLPVLYASSRMNILHHLEGKTVFHIKFYPMELTLWFIATSFLSFIISHLLADILLPYRESLYHFSFLLIALGLGMIIYCELNANKFHLSSKRSSYETQGRYLSFEILFIMLLIFEVNH